NNRYENKCLSIAIIKTLDLYNFIKKHENYIYNKRSDNEFIYVKWEDLKNFNINLKMLIL
ncbi:MAG: hypothetical protein ACOC80_16910, partial [Petrotogales bacterium]